MSIVSYSYDSRAIESFLARLGSVALSDSVKRAVANGMLESTKRTFEQERSPAGISWQPLAPSTRKRSRATRAGILRDTGVMFSTLRPILIGGQPSLAIGAGIGDPRAEVAQNGGGRSPARPYFPIGERASDEWWVPVTKPVRDAWRDTR